MSRGTDSPSARPPGRRRLLFFIATGEPNSLVAQANLEKILHGAPGFEFDVRTVDVFENHESALEMGVLVTPCLVLVEPEPRVMIVGTLTDPRKVRAALRLFGAEKAADA